MNRWLRKSSLEGSFFTAPSYILHIFSGCWSSLQAIDIAWRAPSSTGTSSKTWKKIKKTFLKHVEVFWWSHRVQSVPKMSPDYQWYWNFSYYFGLKISHLVENYFCFRLLAKPDESQAFENFATLKIRLLFKHLVSLLKCFFVVSIVQPVINRP